MAYEPTRAPKLSWYLTRGSGTSRCRYRECRKLVHWMKNVNTGKWMPFDQSPKIHRSEVREVEPGRHEQVALVDLNESHYGTCAGVAKLREKGAIR